MADGRYLAIGAGGALGAALRWGAAALLGEAGTSFPTTTFVVNVVGCAVLGIVLAEEWSHPRARLVLHDFAGIGICGGLTTFSTLSVDAVALVRGGDARLAAAYVGVSLVAGIGAYVAAGLALRRVRALALPLEEAP